MARERANVLELVLHHSRPEKNAFRKALKEISDLLCLYLDERMQMLSSGYYRDRHCYLADDEREAMAKLRNIYWIALPAVAHTCRTLANKHELICRLYYLRAQVASTALQILQMSTTMYEHQWPDGLNGEVYDAYTDDFLKGLGQSGQAAANICEDLRLNIDLFLERESKLRVKKCRKLLRKKGDRRY